MEQHHKCMTCDSEFAIANLCRFIQKRELCSEYAAFRSRCVVLLHLGAFKGRCVVLLHVGDTNEIDPGFRVIDPEPFSHFSALGWHC